MSDSMTEAIDELSPGSQPPRSAVEGADITVLVVDDEASNLASLEKIFQREGMRVFTADGAKASLERERRHRVQVVLTDLMMPGTSGVELLRALKRSEEHTSELQSRSDLVCR